MKIRKRATSPATESSGEKEWGPVRITLVAIAVALGIDFCVFIVTGRSDLFNTLLRNF